MSLFSLLFCFTLTSLPIHFTSSFSLTVKCVLFFQALEATKKMNRELQRAFFVLNYEFICSNSKKKFEKNIVIIFHVPISFLVLPACWKQQFFHAIHKCESLSVIKFECWIELKPRNLIAYDGREGRKFAN